MRRPILAANWKMNMTAAETVNFIKEVKPLISSIDSVDIILFPSFISVAVARTAAKGTNIRIGAQNMFYDDNGAYTGEVSAQMVSEFCSHVIIGHSERRKYFGETDESVNKKVIKAISYGITPIVCIGESKAERNTNKTQEVLHRQIFEALKMVKPEEAEKIVIAYEPRWAISGGDPLHKPATPGDVQEVHSYIRSVLEIIYDKDISSRIRILYGGSLKPENVKDFVALPDVDGGLVGKASLDPVKFVEMIKITSQ